jgi:hypothetical protein
MATSRKMPPGGLGPSAKPAPVVDRARGSSAKVARLVISSAKVAPLVNLGTTGSSFALAVTTGAGFALGGTLKPTFRYDESRSLTDLRYLRPPKASRSQKV